MTGAGALAVGVDQATKLAVRPHPEDQTILGDDTFSIRHVENEKPDAFRDKPFGNAVGIAVLAAVGLGGAVVAGRSTPAWCAGGVIAASGLSNLVEGGVRGEVTDMLGLGTVQNGLTANVADVALFAGLATLAMVGWRHRRGTLASISRRL